MKVMMREMLKVRIRMVTSAPMELSRAWCVLHIVVLILLACFTKMDRIKTRPNNNVRARLPWINCKPYLDEQIPVLEKPKSNTLDIRVSTGINLSSASSTIV